MVYKRIVLPIDGSKMAKKAEDKALEIAKILDLPIKAIYVIDMNIYSDTISNDQTSTYWENILRNEGLTLLKEIKKKGETKEVHVTTKILTGHPSEQIIKEAGKNDLIIMGSKGKSAFDRILLGSITENVLHHSNASVMIIR
jgi:nucleotide-binding universal stress UspA family protein